jgi:hypothetical protein
MTGPNIELSILENKMRQALRADSRRRVHKIWRIKNVLLHGEKTAHRYSDVDCKIYIWTEVLTKEEQRG